MGKYLVKASNIVDSVECNFELDILGTIIFIFFIFDNL